MIIGLTAGCTQNETTTAPNVSTTIVPTTSESKNATNQSGNANTNLNVFNYGMVCSKDDWVYYSDLTEMKLYKVKVDGSQKVKISDSGAMFINLVGDWLYFVNGSYDQLDPENGKLFKMKTEGSDRKQLGDLNAQFPYVEGDSLYFMGIADNKSKLYKIETDGSSTTTLSEDQMLGFMVEQGWIYYILPKDGAQGILYKMKTDGTAKTPLSQEEMTSFAVHDGWIYYRLKTKDSEPEELIWYRMKTDGSASMKIGNLGTGNINIQNDWIYYGVENQPVGGQGNTTYQFGKIKTDGTGQTVLSEENAALIYLYNDLVYYVSFDFSFSSGLAFILNRMKPDGTDKLVVAKTDLSLMPTPGQTSELPEEGDNPPYAYDAGKGYTITMSKTGIALLGE